MNILLDVIRAKFPNPIEYSKSTILGKSYCVGGAAKMFIEGEKFIYKGENVRFPTAEELRSAIETVNPTLDAELMDVLIEEVFQYNDEGKFEAAWYTLGELFRVREYSLAN